MNFWLLSPELSLCGIALAVVLLDLVVENKKILAGISVAALAVPIAFIVALWGEQQSTFGGMLVVDEFSLFFKFLLVGITGLVIVSSVDYVKKFARFQGEYYALVLFSAAGLMLMAGTGELISIYVALELSSLSLYALVAFLKDPKSSEAGLKYMILGAISSAVLLFGMAFVFGLTGTTHLDQIADKVSALVSGGQIWDSPALVLGMVFLVAGFGFKIASVPFQMWVPDVYEGAPTPITAYLSVASKAAGFAVILRVFYTAFGVPVLSESWSMLFAVLGAISMTIGNVVAIAQTNIKRMLGYSSIAHAGYLMVGLATVSTLGRSGILFFLASYALANLGAFIAIIAISNKTGSDEIKDFSGMSRRAPALALVLALCLISLIGIPPTGGFIAKFYIFNAAIQQDLLWLVIIAVLNSVISAYYYLRVVRVMYLGEPASQEAVPSSIPLRAALTITSLGVLLLGIYPWVVLRLAETAAAVLIP
ncbi:MAG TPA: NADH-quinone oxidoreductase subunit N [Dehalococcoidia bacterium]|nr:NADH-quinone oxidoreductase subunit N [Dehalococcoidia bacterium]